MKCISLHQPWASYLINGDKRIETRHWPIRHRGPLLIHAAKNTESCSTSQKETLPFGALLGIVELIGCERTETLRERITTTEEGFGNFGDGRFGWITKDPQPFDKPIPYKGQQGLFNVPNDLIHQKK